MDTLEVRMWDIIQRLNSTGAPSGDIIKLLARTVAEHEERQAVLADWFEQCRKNLAYLGKVNFEYAMELRDLRDTNAELIKASLPKGV